MKQILILLMTASMAMAGFHFSAYKVHYSWDGVGYDVVVQAQSSQEAKDYIENIIPGSTVTNVMQGAK
jgi:hypothetical protein